MSGCSGFDGHIMTSQQPTYRRAILAVRVATKTMVRNHFAGAMQSELSVHQRAAGFSIVEMLSAGVSATVLPVVRYLAETFGLTVAVLSSLPLYLLYLCTLLLV